MQQQQPSERIAYPTLPKPLSTGDLRRLFSPLQIEIDWAFRVSRSSRTRCRMLTLLKVFQALGRFVPLRDLDPSITVFVARQAGLVEPRELRYAPRTRRRYQAQVREYLGVTKWNHEARALAEATMESLAAARAQPADLINAAIEALVQHHFELPALSTLRRLVGMVHHRVSEQLFARVSARLSDSDCRILDRLVEVPEGARSSLFAKLCQAAGRATKKNLRAQAQRIDWLESFIEPTKIVQGIPPVKVEQWADEARRLNATELSAYRPSRRRTLLVSLLYMSRAHILDDLITMFIKTMRKMQHQAEADLEAWVAKRRKTTEGLVSLLNDLAHAYRDADGPHTFYRSTGKLFDDHGGLSHVIEQCEDRLKHRGRDWRPFARPYFDNQRSVLMDLLEIIPLRSIDNKLDLLNAITCTSLWRSERMEWFQMDLDVSFLSKDWRRLVRSADAPDVFHRRTMEMAVLFELYDAFMSGNIYVPGSASYGAMTEHLYPTDSNPEVVATYLSDRELPPDAKTFVRDVRWWLLSHIGWFDRAVGEDQFVALNRQKLPVVPRPTANLPPETALELEKRLLERLPTRTVLEALYNTNRWTGWTKRFGPPARMRAQIADPVQRYVLTSFAYGCGLGPAQASRHFDEDVPPYALSFANRRHVGKDSLRAACSDLIDLYAQFELPRCWGAGQAAAADGTLFETYDSNLLAAHHVRYGGTGGIAYRHIADNYVALFTQFIPCGVHEATFILEGLLENTSKVQPTQLHADSHGQSAVVFGLAYLLGIDLMPRIRNWRSLKLYRADANGMRHTRHLFADPIDWDLIEAHWEDYLRVVLAIQHGMVSSSWVLARLNSHSQHNRLYLAFRELGRVVRTVYLLRWIESEGLRDTVNQATNKVESFHQFADYLRFGDDGTLRTNDPAEQEKAVIYNQLVANAVILQTVADQTTALRELDREGHSIEVEDLAYLSPYVTTQLKRFGDYPARCNTEPLAERALPG